MRNIKLNSGKVVNDNVKVMKGVKKMNGKSKRVAGKKRGPKIGKRIDEATVHLHNWASEKQKAYMYGLPTKMIGKKYRMTVRAFDGGIVYVSMERDDLYGRVVKGMGRGKTIGKWSLKNSEKQLLVEVGVNVNRLYIYRISNDSVGLCNLNKIQAAERLKKLAALPVRKSWFDRVKGFVSRLIG